MDSVQLKSRTKIRMPVLSNFIQHFSKLLELSLVDDFFGSDSKSKGNKSKNKQVGLHQTKKLLHDKENHQQNEMVYPNWEKIYAIHVSDKWLTSKIYKELIPLNSKQTNKNSD